MAPPDRKVRGKSFGNANAYLFAYHQTSQDQYLKMLQMVVAQQQLELQRADVLRKQLADLDDRIIAYEKLAAEFETPTGGTSRSGTTKNFRLEAEMEIASLRAKEDATKAGVIEEVGRDTYAAQSSVSQFLAKSGDRSTIITAGAGNTDNLVLELQDAYYTNIINAEGAKNSIAKQDAVANLMNQVNTELRRAGITGTEKDKVMHQLGLMAGVLSAADPVSTASTAKVFTALGPSGLSSARNAEIDTRLRGSGIGFLDDDSGVKGVKGFPASAAGGNFTNAELIRYRGATGARTYGGTQAKAATQIKGKDKALDNVLVSVLRNDGLITGDEAKFAEDQVKSIIGSDKAYAGLLKPDGSVDFQKLFQSRVGASVRVQQASQLGQLQQERQQIRTQLGRTIGTGKTPEQMLGQAGQLRDQPLPTAQPESRIRSGELPPQFNNLTPQQRMQMDYMSQATAFYKSGETPDLSFGAPIYSDAKAKLSRGELTKQQVFDYVNQEAMRLYQTDTEKARDAQKRALQRIYLDDLKAFDIQTQPAGEK